MTFTLDTRLKQAERELTAMRRKAMKVARLVHEADKPNLHWQTMLLVDTIDGIADRVSYLQEEQRLRHEAEDLDIERERRAEARRESFRTVEAEDYARLVRRSTDDAA